MRNIEVKKCASCPCNYLDDYNGVVRCSIDENLDLSIEFENEDLRYFQIPVIPKGCPLKIEPICLSAPQQ